MPTYVSYLDNAKTVVTDAVAGGAVSAYYLVTHAGASYMLTADPATSGRMPVLGMNTQNLVSGQKAQVIMQGVVSHALLSGLTSGALVFVASGGRPTPTAPTGSGDIVQRIGFADSGSSIVLTPDLTYFQVGQ